MSKLIALIAMLLALAGTITPAAAAPAAGGMIPRYAATAAVSDATPGPNRVETVTGRLTLAGQPIAGATMRVTWWTKAGTRTCTAGTGPKGIAWCGQAIGHPAIGVPVGVTVTFLRYGHVLATTTTRFTPREGGRG